MHARGTGKTCRAVALVVPTGEDGRRRRASATALLLVLACGLALRPLAALAGWPLAQPAAVQLGFGSAYSTGGDGSAQHRGVDLAAADGDRVVAPLAGRVSFVGRVPGVGGGRVLAVTLETASGNVTLLPLASTAVAKGDSVGEGGKVGSVAGGGDGSSAGAHLHVGVRLGELYVDPLSILAPPPASGAHTDGVEAGEPQGADAAAADPVAGGVVVPGGAAAGAGVAAGAVAGGVVAGEIAPGVSIAAKGARAGSRSQAAADAPAAAGAAVAAAAAAATSGARATVLTADGIVVPAGQAAAAPTQAAGTAWLARSIARLRARVAGSLKLAGLVLLGALVALGSLWPLWRGAAAAREGLGKVCVSTVEEDVAAAPSR